MHACMHKSSPYIHLWNDHQGRESSFLDRTSRSSCISIQYDMDQLADSWIWDYVRQIGHAWLLIPSCMLGMNNYYSEYHVVCMIIIEGGERDETRPVIMARVKKQDFLLPTIYNQYILRAKAKRGGAEGYQGPWVVIFTQRISLRALIDYGQHGRRRRKKSARNRSIIHTTMYRISTIAH